MGKGGVIGIGKCGGDFFFFRIWGTRRVFVRMREMKRAHMAPVSAACVKVT